MIPLPALVGQDPLGWLAAVGALVLLDHAEVPARLSWEPAPGGATDTAVLHADLDLPGLVKVLAGVAEDTDPNWPIPGITGFPLPSPSRGGDPHRRPLEQYNEILAEITEYEACPHLTLSRAGAWMTRVLNNTTRDGRGLAALTPWMAPQGRQTIGSFFRKPLEEVRADPQRLITEALTCWRRVKGSNGQGLDERAPYGAADTPEGGAGSMGVPAATWFATHALAVTRLGQDGRGRASCTGWHYTSDILGRVSAGWVAQQVAVWPVWNQPWDVRTVEAVWGAAPWFTGLRFDDGLSAFERVWEYDGGDYDEPGGWGLQDLKGGLGVVGLAAAYRERGEYSWGPLLPMRVRYGGTQPRPA